MSNFVSQQGLLLDPKKLSESFDIPSLVYGLAHNTDIR